MTRWPAAICLAGLTFWPLSAVAQSKPPTEYEVKAAYLYNFARFVEWPGEALPENTSRLVICILGRDLFGSVLDEVIEGRTIQGRTLAVRRIKGPAEAGKCQILFVSASEEERLGEILAAVEGKSILTVGESEPFARLGGMINFVMEANRVRFEINPKAAARARLTLSSQLLKVARIVGSNARPS